MAKIIVFTDLHITAGQRIIGLDPNVRFAEGLSHALAMHPDADRIVCTGDLTNKGDAESYARLREILAAAPMPVDLLIGNHDERDAFKAAFPGQATDADGFVQGVVELDDASGGRWRLAYLDTLNAPPYAFPETYSGFLCEKRLAWLDARLGEAPGVPAIVFLHHPPHDIGFDGMDGIKLKNGPAFYDVLERHGTVRHIVAGHVHRTISGAHRGIPFSIFKSPCHQQPMLLGSDDLSASVDEPGAYGILITTPHGVIVHTEDWALTEGAQVYSDQAALGAGAG